VFNDWLSALQMWVCACPLPALPGTHSYPPKGPSPPHGEFSPPFYVEKQRVLPAGSAARLRNFCRQHFAVRRFNSP
jgi:hypothetical protein